MAHSTRYDTQRDSREDVGVVSLARVEGASIGQRHLVKRTSTGKDAAALITEESKRRASTKQGLCYESLLSRRAVTFL